MRRIVEPDLKHLAEGEKDALTGKFVVYYGII
jgi:hypothetical protein